MYVGGLDETEVYAASSVAGQQFIRVHGYVQGASEVGGGAWDMYIPDGDTNEWVARDADCDEDEEQEGAPVASDNGGRI